MIQYHNNKCSLQRNIPILENIPTTAVIDIIYNKNVKMLLQKLSCKKIVYIINTKNLVCKNTYDK